MSKEPENNLPDFIQLEADDGTTINLEVIESMDYNGEGYTLFLPADMSEDDPDYGFIILHDVYEGNEMTFEDVDDERTLNEVYDRFMAFLYADEDEEEDK